MQNSSVPYQVQSCPGVNPLIMPIPRDFLLGCIDLYLYLAHACSNDHYCWSVLGYFFLVSTYLLTIFEDFALEQKILDSPIHTLWLNIKARTVLCMSFLLERPQGYLHFFSASLEIWHHPLNVNVLSLWSALIRKITVLIEYGSVFGCHPGPVS